MPHSMVLAEPIGLIAGIVAGRVGGRFGRHVAQELGVPTWIGGLVGAAAAHYLSAAVTKAIINATLLDPVGGTANVTVTSPLTSVTHGLFDALTDAIPDLGGWLGELFNDSSLVDTVGEFLSDALPTTPDEVRDALAEAGIDPATYSSEQIDALTTNFSHASASHGEPRFAGFGGVDLINDSQGMSPTCFPESVENIFQLYQGDVSGINNDLVHQVVAHARAMGWTDANGVILNEYHQHVFHSLGIPTELVEFDHQYFQIHLDRQCPIQQGVDSAYFNNPISGPHSVTLVDLKPDVDGRWWYRVLDSAYPQQQWYPADVVESAAQSAKVKWGLGGHNGRAIVCKLPAINWPFRT